MNQSLIFLLNCVQNTIIPKCNDFFFFSFLHNQSPIVIDNIKHLKCY